MTIAKVLSAQPGALKAQLVQVETDVSVGIYNFLIVGLPNKEVDEAKDRVAAAIKNSGIPSPKSENRKIVTSLAPSSIKKEGTHFDLPIALSYLKATGQICLPESTTQSKGKINTAQKEDSENSKLINSDNSIFVGELSLSGEVSPVSGVLSIAQMAKEVGIKNIFLPEKNKEEAALVENLNIFPVTSLTQIIHFFSEYNETGVENIEKQGYLEKISGEQENIEDPFYS